MTISYQNLRHSRAGYVNNYLVNLKFSIKIEFEQNNFLSIQVQKHSSALIENQWPYRRSARQDSNCLFTTFLQLVCSSNKKVQGSRFFLHVKHEYLRSRASTCLSLSSTSPVISQIRDITLIEILVLTSWISHPRIFDLKCPKMSFRSFWQYMILWNWW